MFKTHLARLYLLVGFANVVFAAQFKFDAHISHGINVFNDNLLANYSGSSNIFNTLGRIYEVGSINPGGDNASVITDSTPPRTLMATMDPFVLRNTVGFPRGIGPFNVPIQRTPTMFFGSTSVNDRVTPMPFSASTDVLSLNRPYLAQGAMNAVRVSDWSKASGRLSGFCRGTRAVINIEIRNALPNAVYTLWDVGVTDALTPDEDIHIGPFGGVPNVLASDSRGRGSFRRALNYCPVDRCAGSTRCTLHISLFYHFDHVVYGGAPTLDFGGQPVGQNGAVHLQWFLNARPVVPPQNRF